jgi:hypothetical protein
MYSFKNYNNFLMSESFKPTISADILIDIISNFTEMVDFGYV